MNRNLNVLIFNYLFVQCFIKQKRRDELIKTRADEEALIILDYANEYLLPVLEKNYEIKIEEYTKYFSCLYIFTKLIDEDIDEILELIMIIKKENDFIYLIKFYLNSEANDCKYIMSLKTPEAIQRFINKHRYFGPHAVVDDVLIYILETSREVCHYDGRFNDIAEKRLNKYIYLRESFESIINTKNDLNVVKAMIDVIIYYYEVEHKINAVLNNLLSEDS